MQTRSPRGEATQKRIILAAADLFHKQGVNATSPNQVMEASGTGKSQFYHYFESKDGLVHAVLQHYVQAIRDGTAFVQFDVNSWEDLEEWFRGQAQLQSRYSMMRGCPFGTIANEVTADDELLRQDLVLLFEVVRNKLATFFLREKAHGHLLSTADENALADFCIATIQGAMLMGKIRRDRGTVDEVIHHALYYLQSFRRTA